MWGDTLLMSARESLQYLIDELQFRFDLFPTGDYQPLPWLGLRKAKRATGTKMRWNAIWDSLKNDAISSGMDIGCNMGFFCFSLAEKGIPMLGIDLDPRYIRIASYVAKRTAMPGVAFSLMAVELQTMPLLPRTDLVLLLSVWHHWVKLYGLETASQMLTALWGRCEKVLFFETGETEMSGDFGLSVLGESPREWLQTYLEQTCPRSSVEHLGQFKAFAPNGNEERNVAYRNLFKVTRLQG